MLEKISHQIEKIGVTLEIHGVYSFPEEWKKTDEVNPTIFKYQVYLLGLEVLEGKILPRQPTGKELKEIEEQTAAKNKKQAKKDTKDKE